MPTRSITIAQRVRPEPITEEPLGSIPGSSSGRDSPDMSEITRNNPYPMATGPIHLVIFESFMFFSIPRPPVHFSPCHYGDTGGRMEHRPKDPISTRTLVLSWSRS